MESLPRDIMADILSRLIVKHLLQCKSVSHTWIAQTSEDPNNYFQCDARLYSLSTNTWKKLPDIPYCLFRLHMMAIFLNGALHFLATEIPQQSMPDKIVAFNLHLETYYSVPPPIFGQWPQHRAERRWLTIGVLDGCLTQIDNYCPEDHHFVVWIMKEYGVHKSWTKLYRIAYPDPIPMFNIGREHSIPASLRPISFSKNKKQILFMVHFSHLVSYDLESKTLHQVVHHNDQVVTWDMLLYEETLTSPLAGSNNGDHDEESMGLPEDIVINILLRLPVKSLLRFKSVSWPWYDLIADASFAPRHLEWSRKTSSKLHIVYTGAAFTLRHAEFDSFNGDASLDHPLVGENHTPIVVGATDGLLCLCDTSTIHLIFPFALYNPTTRSSHVLPSPLLDGFSTRFDHYLGFGYDATNDDYKVVKIAQQSKRDEPLRDFAQVYSLNTNSWKWVTPSPFRLSEFLFSGVCVNGVVHWVASSNPNEKLHDAIAAFDIANENYFMVSQPESLEPPLGRRCFLDIGVLEGCLSLVCNYPDMHYHDVWIMREYGVQSSWSKLFRIVDEEQSPVMLRPESYSRDKREVFFMGFSNILLSYNVEENKLRRCDFPNRICWGVHIYEETLVSADAGYINWDEQ
ncbi:F-box protein CPR1-like isoform X2 [Silene latifolia]|uniref:F-box protein CPR1-like isoform X2 n=1 Tax=Silene latifolia TaxID=37657 RepID=UPI003D76A9D1